MKGRDVEVQLNIDLDPELGSLPHQLCGYIRRAISRGDLKAGDRISPSRKLARELGLARGTVTVAIEMLVAEGLLEARIGSGTYVAEAARPLFSLRTPPSDNPFPRPENVPRPDTDQTIKGMIDFTPCRPSLEAFPVKAWRRCVSMATSVVPESDYGNPRGSEALRRNILEYLRRARGLSASIDNIIITNGSVHAMHILSKVYLDNAATVVVENPGYPLARQVFDLSGANVMSCAVDDNGLRTEDLPELKHGSNFVYVTPSHQFPTGFRLSLERRHALIEWANRNSALIIEDDYDGEFRYDVPPLAPLATLSTDRVVYCGTFSKTMFPGLRIGFAIADRAIIDAMAAYRTISEYAPNTPLQMALYNFITEGHFERHVHRMKRIYRAKRQRVFDTLTELGLPANLKGLDSGISVLMKLTDSTPASQISMNAKRKGILIPSVSRYDFSNRLPDDALIFGYATASKEQIAMGIARIFSS